MTRRRRPTWPTRGLSPATTWAVRLDQLTQTCHTSDISAKTVPARPRIGSANRAITGNRSRSNPIAARQPKAARLEKASRAWIVPGSAEFERSVIHTDAKAASSSTPRTATARRTSNESGGVRRRGTSPTKAPAVSSQYGNVIRVWPDGVLRGRDWVRAGIPRLGARSPSDRRSPCACRPRSSGPESPAAPSAVPGSTDPPQRRCPSP
jgi:hypothetical protein